MANITKIQWADATLNFWHGCKKVSPGCKFCYMYRDKATRYGQDPTVVKRSKPATIKNAIKGLQPGARIFTCSWSDFFIEEADAWRPEAWEFIRQHPEFIFMILTKRIERVKDCLPPDWEDVGGYSNVWLGVSVESPAYLWRVSLLMRTVATMRFISYEPALAAVDFSRTPNPAYVDDSGRIAPPSCISLDGAPAYGNCFTVRGENGEYMEGENGIFGAVDWLIIGGESGNESGEWRYRPAEVDWFTAAAQLGRDAGAAVFVKQMGTHIAKANGYKDRNGGDPDEWPAALRVREFPFNGIHGTEEGSICNRAGCLGTMEYGRENCSCHISPPCSACVDALLICSQCGHEIE